MTRIVAHLALTLAAGAGVLVLCPTAAYAQEDCASDADCPQGFVCEVIGSSGCAATPCASGEECPEPVPCEPEEWTACVPGPCTSDADCAAGLECLTITSESCYQTDVACEPGTECIVPEPVCETQTESMCAPPWAGPCTVDADCGPGFSCVPEEVCWCEGSAGSSDGSEPAPPPEETCGCEPTGENYCALQEIPCASAADCPADWTCEASVEGDCSVSSDGSEPVCETVSTEQRCMPPYWSEVVGTPGGVDYEADAAGAPQTAADGDEDATAPTDDSASGGGCSVGGSGSSSAPALLLLGLVGWLARRRLR